MFAELGLSEEAELVYRTVLAEPAWGAADLAVHLRLTERAVRKALDQLADLALLRRAPDSEAFQVVSPQVGLAALLTCVEEQVRQRQRGLDATREAIAAIVNQHASRKPDGVDGIRLEGVEAVRSRLAELAYAATKECWSFSPGASRRPEAMEASRPLNRAAIERGVELRCVYQDAHRNDPATVAHARWLAGLGGKLRTVPRLPMQLIIVDRNVAILPISPTDPRVGALEVHNPGLLVAICALFEQVWSIATPLDCAAARNDHGLSPSEQEVLKLLAMGHTDETVARRLGVSVRTVRRTIAEFTERLDATSRFQAGVRSVQCGWL